MTEKKKTWFVVQRMNPGETYFVVVGPFADDDVWSNANPGGWTYQEVTGSHGTIVHETGDEADAVAVCARNNKKED